MATTDTNAEVIDGTAVEIHHPPAVIPPIPPSLDVVPTVEAGDLVKRLDVIKQAQSAAMVQGTDYGVIPGTDKPTLLKPGAEKLGVLFQLDVQITNEKVWGPGEHLTVVSHATVFHAPTGARLGYGEGVCTTREKKYAKRKADPVCPNCGKPAIIKGKAEYGGGWVCWKKRDGCDSKFRDGDQAIEAQPRGDVDNPDLPDLWNTVVKMAEKRARVDAVLAVTGASALFTQDMEDAPPQEPPAPAPEPPAPPQQRQAPQTTAQPAQPSERAASGPQKGAINARMAAGSVKEDDAKAILQWAAGTAVVDRVSKAAASKLIDRLGQDGSGAQEILDEISTEAERGDERARTIVSRYFEVTPHA